MWTAERKRARTELVVVCSGSRTHVDPPERTETNRRIHGRRERAEHTTTAARRQSAGRAHKDSGAQASAHTQQSRAGGAYTEHNDSGAQAGARKQRAQAGRRTNERANAGDQTVAIVWPAPNRGPTVVLSN